MVQDMTVPAGFEDLVKFAKWDLPTADERYRIRREATGQELKEF